MNAFTDALSAWKEHIKSFKNLLAIVVTADKCESLINKGYKFIGVLPNGKVVLEKVNAVQETS